MNLFTIHYKKNILSFLGNNHKIVYLNQEEG